MLFCYPICYPKNETLMDVYCNHLKRMVPKRRFELRTY